MLYDIKDYASGTWIMYLRKSRQDDPNETVEGVLAKHETLLQEYAMRELGYKIQEGNIYREIVSGESIADRVEIKKVISRLESPEVAGVLCMEPSRLSRGDLADCARIISAFRFTHSLIATPMMIYNLENKMERKFFQDELLRGNDYLEYTKEILMRGRIASVKRGCYLPPKPPYGYKKVYIGKEPTLEIIEDEAEIVRMIFNIYINEGVTAGRIARRLNRMGIPGPTGDIWHNHTVWSMVRNAHYAGYVYFNYIKSVPVLENGEVIVRRLRQPEEEVIMAEGKHEAIIDRETWEAAKAVVSRAPRVKRDRSVKNPYSGLLRCAKCGKMMSLHPYKKAEDRYECRTVPLCYKTVISSALDAAVITALEESELPALQLRVKNNDGDSAKIQQRRLASLEAKMKELRAQEEKQFDLLETGVYTQDLFDRRNAALRKKMDECLADIQKTRLTLPNAVDYPERILALQAAIDILKDPSATPGKVNEVLKTIIDHIDYTGAEVDGKRRTKEPMKFSIAITLKL